MGRLLCICAILTICSLTEANWQLRQYIDVEKLLISIQGNVEKLYNFVQQEKRAQFGQNAPNATFTGGLSAAYSSFVQDVELRLGDIENATAELAQRMRICPDTPNVPPSPTNIQIESKTEGSSSAIVVSWDPMPHIDSSNLHYKVYFQPIEPDGTTRQQEVIFKICDSTQTSASITDLSPRRKYRVKVGAVDGTMVEALSREKILRTPDIVPSEPLDVDGIAMGPNEIKLAWKPPLIRGEIVAYIVQHYDTFTNENFTYSVVPPLPEFIVKDLTEGVLHVFTVTARSDNGESKPSLPARITTIEFIPPEIFQIRVFGLNTTAVQVEFQAPYSPNGIVRGYRIFYTDFMNEEGSVDVSTPEQSMAILTNLTPNKGYYVSVVGYTRRSSNKPINYAYVRTRGAVPSPVRNVRCRTLRNDPPMVKLTWMPPRRMYSTKAPIYHIFWGVDNGVFRNETIKNMSVSWDSDYLDDNLNHTFIIAAENEEGLGGEVEVKLKTPKRIFATPSNIKVGRVKRGNETLLSVSWDRMHKPITGYRVLYRVFQWVYKGRWNIVEVDNPNAIEKTIPISDPTLSYIVVVRAKQDHLRKKPRRRNKWGFPWRSVRHIPCSIKYYPKRTHRLRMPSGGGQI